MRIALAIVLALAAAPALANNMPVCMGTISSVLSGGTYQARCSSSWITSPNTFNDAEWGPVAYSYAEQLELQLIDVDGRLDALESGGTVPADPMDADLWLSHLGGLLGAYVLGIAFGGIQAWARAILHKMEGIQ